MPRKRTTKSSRSSKTSPQDDGAVQSGDSVVKSAPSLQRKGSQTSMAEDNTEEMDDIIDYDDDVSDAEAPDPIPVGTYPAQIVSAEKKVSGKGNNYINVGFQISTDDYPADFPVENEPDGVRLSYMRLSPDNRPRARFAMKKFIEAVGAKGGKSINIKEWIGLEAKLRVSHDTYEGMPQARIDAVLPLE